VACSGVGRLSAQPHGDHIEMLIPRQRRRSFHIFTQRLPSEITEVTNCDSTAILFDSPSHFPWNHLAHQPPFEPKTPPKKFASPKTPGTRARKKPQRVAPRVHCRFRLRNRSEFLIGRDGRRQSSPASGQGIDYRLIKDFGHFKQRIAVRFAYEWHDDSAVGSAHTEMQTGIR